jgi:hypothetical protein
MVRPDSSLQPDRYERRTSVSFVDFTEFSFAFDRVSCALSKSFLVPFANLG